MKKTIAYLMTGTALLVGVVAGVALGLAANEKPSRSCEVALDMYEEMVSDIADAGTLAMGAANMAVGTVSKALRDDFNGVTADLEEIGKKSDSTAELLEGVSRDRVALAAQVRTCTGW